MCVCEMGRAQSSARTTAPSHLGRTADSIAAAGGGVPQGHEAFEGGAVGRLRGGELTPLLW